MVKLTYAHAHKLGAPNVKLSNLSNKATSVMDSHCLPWFWLNSIALCNRLHFYSHDFGVRYLSSISIHNEKFSHHVTNVRQQLTVIGHQRSSSFPCPLPNGIFLFSARKSNCGKSYKSML